MKNKTHEQLLDFVLESIQKNKYNQIDIHNILEERKNDYVNLISQLRNDKLIMDESSNIDGRNKNYYILTGSGTQFLLNGGYVAKKKREDDLYTFAEKGARYSKKAYIATIISIILAVIVPFVIFFIEQSNKPVVIPDLNNTSLEIKTPAPIKSKAKTIVNDSIKKK